MTLYARAIALARSSIGRALSGSMVSAVMSRLMLFALAAVVARPLGPSGYGAFTFATGIAMMGGQFSGLGWPMLMNRLIPRFVTDGDMASLRGLVRAGDVVTLAVGLVAAGLVAAIACFAGDLQLPLFLAAVLLVPNAFIILRRQQLIAVHRPALGMLFDQGFAALLMLGVVLVLGVGGIMSLILEYAVAMAASMVIATLLFRRSLPRQISTVTARYEIGLWMKTAVPMVIGTSSRLIMSKIDVLMLPALATLYEAGLYGAAMRLTYILSFPRIVLLGVMMPRISKAFAANDRARLITLLRGANAFVAITALPAAIIIALIPTIILRLAFGDAFADGATTLILLTISQLIASFAAPYSVLLMMGGGERGFGALNGSALALNMLLCMFLIPGYGAEGAAMATLIATVLMAAGQMLLGRRIISPSRDQAHV